MASRLVTCDALDQLTAREYLTLLDQELSKLPEKYRLPLLMHYLQGMSHDNAAKQLKVTVKVFRGRLDRGRACLRKRLARRGIDWSNTIVGDSDLLQVQRFSHLAEKLMTLGIQTIAQDHSIDPGSGYANAPYP